MEINILPMKIVQYRNKKTRRMAEVPGELFGYWKVEYFNIQSDGTAWKINEENFATATAVLAAAKEWTK